MFIFFGWVVLFLKLKLFSLLVSCPRGRERDAASELWYVLTSDLGEDDVNVEVTEVPGLITAFSSSDPFSVISRLRKMLEEGSLNLSLCSKFVPLEVVVPTNLDRIKEGVEKLKHKISQDERWRVTLRKRFTGLESDEVIMEVADLIDWGVVDLKNPDKILRIEIVGGWTGISIHSPEEEFSVQKK